MKALVLSRDSKIDRFQFRTKNKIIDFREVPDPVMSRGDALIKVRIAGICRTDIELAKGYMDFQGIPGHEFVGDVLSVDESVAEQGKGFIGRRVVAEINCGCGNCEWCNSGLERHCPDRTVLGILHRDGAFAEQLTIPLRNLHIVPEPLNDIAAVFTEPVAAAMEIFEQVKIRPSDRVLVVGDGKLGLLIAKVLQIHGCDLFCAGGDRKKIAILRSWGIQAVHLDDFQPAVFDLVVEASGSPKGFSSALASLKPRGTLILKSTYSGSLSFDAAPLVINEISVLGSRCGPFEPALRLLKQGFIPTDQLVTKIYPAEKAAEAFKHAARPDALKVMIIFSD